MKIKTEYKLSDHVLMLLAIQLGSIDEYKASFKNQLQLSDLLTTVFALSAHWLIP